MYRQIGSPSFGAFGDTKSYWGISPVPEEIYVLRCQTSMVPVVDPLSAMQFVKVVGHIMPKYYDIRGIAIQGLSPGDLRVNPLKTIDVVVTTSYANATTRIWWKTDSTMLKDINESEEFKTYFPGGVVLKSEWLQLTGPESSIVQWRRSPILWDHNLSSSGGRGGPTEAFGMGEGAWIGLADSTVNKMPTVPIPIIPPTPVVPSGGGAPPGGTPEELNWRVVAGVAGVGLVGGLGWWFMHNRKG